MKTDRNLFLKTVFSAAVLAFAPFFCAAAAVESEYWRGDKELREGVKVKELSFTEPRLMKAWMMRIDLRTPGIGFTTTERDARWGEPMPDYTNGVRLIRTKRKSLGPGLEKTSFLRGNCRIFANRAKMRSRCGPNVKA